MRHGNSLTRSFLVRYIFGVICSVLLIGLLWLYSSWQELHGETLLLKEQAIEQQREQLRQRVHHAVDMIRNEQKRFDVEMHQQVRQRTLEAYAVMQSIYDNSKDRYSTDQIADMIRNALRAITYNGGRGYFFATRLDGVEQLFPPQPALEGTSILNIRDINDKPVVQDMIQLVREKEEGFYRYTWAKPGSQGQHAKLAYIKYFAPLNWLIGTGEYIDDLQADLRQEVLRRLEENKFKDGGYIFAATYQGISLTYPAKGRNVYQVEDANGLKIVQELIKLAKAGEGFLRYVMPSLEGGVRQEAKISYVVGIPEWGWYVGSGDFVADLDHALATMLAEREATLQKKLWAIITTLAMFLLLGVLLARQLGRQAHASFQNFQHFFARAASQAKPIEVESQSFREFQQLAESANRMLEERQLFEQQANDYQDQLQNVIDAMPSILTTIDLDGRILQWNKFAVATTHILQENAVSKKLPVVLPYLQTCLAEILTTIIEKQQFFQRELEVSNRDETRIKQVSAYPLGQPEPTSIVVRVDDITERKLLERTLVQSEKMMSVGGLAAGMAHEVNNPLSAIMQNLHLLQKRLSPDNPRTRQSLSTIDLDADKFQQFLVAGGVTEKIDSALLFCNRAATIIKDILNFSRSGSSDFTPTNLEQLLESTLKLLDNDYDFRRYYNFRQIGIERNIAEQMPDVPCEASKIQQVVFNLLKNGAQAMSEANVPLDNRRFIIDLFREGDSAVIRIGDSGPGMPEGVRKRIFEPFFTTKAVGKGTGLGLFVSYFIIHEIHNGDLSVDSVPEQGTTFTIKLPLSQQKQL